MMDNDLWLEAQSLLANVTHNWQQKRKYDASLAVPSEGFTEHWGADDDAKSSTVFSRADRLELDLPHPDCPLLLFQYHPAWEEQLALRVAGIEHVVVNSKYAVYESTGPLPCLCDRTKGKPTALVGRTTSSPSSKEESTSSIVPDNGILQYLEDQYKADFTGSLSDENKSTQFLHLIRHTLGPCMVAVRYNDTNTYEQVYRHQSVAASGGGRGFWTAWQVCSERVTALQTLSHAMRRRLLDDIIGEVESVLRIFDNQLQGNRDYLMETDTPHLVDILLWSCLARALSNVHLVTVVAEFDRLCRYVQRIWDKYFAPDYNIGVVDDGSLSVKQWNAVQNEVNAFGRLPLMPQSIQHDFQDAIQIMKQLSVQSHDLHEQLVLARDARQDEDKEVQRRKRNRPFHSWYRWRMGDVLGTKHRGSTPAEASSPQEAKMRRDYQRNDELWLITVAVTTAASVLLFGFATGKSQ